MYVRSPQNRSLWAGEAVKLPGYHRNLHRADRHSLLHFWKVCFTLLVSEFPIRALRKSPMEIWTVRLALPDTR